jgi:transposase InsO family protein
MEEIRKLGKRQKEPQPPRGLARRRRHPFELRLKAVKLRLEEGFPLELIARELGIGKSTISAWTQQYREHGEAGLKSAGQAVVSPRAKIASAVKQRIVELKQEHPRFGVKKIAQVLRRVLFLPGSHETVRRTLHKQQLIEKPRKKPRKNPPKPRFFERSTPNQMWQADIFTFRLGGKNAYLIGFIDDHSRYIVGLDLFRSQTAEHVLEVYRTAVAEYGLPKEMLTDNGRQYTAWRGKTRFEQELRKDHVHHFRSQPHHPMTLGKVERFWKTIWEDFLVRAQFDSFEQARERVRWWVKFYNHKRPHQSLEGLFPADRFFAIAKELRAVIERGIAENVQELALRGRPQEPFYMVGRLGQQSVVLRAEKGHIKMVVDGEEASVSGGELTYQLNQPAGESHDHGKQTQEGTEAVQCPPTSASSTGGVDGTTSPGGSLSANGHQLDATGAVARAGDGRDGGGAAAALSQRATTGASVDGQVGAAVGAPSVDGGRQDGQTGEATGQDANGAGASGADGESEVSATRAETEGVRNGTDTERVGDGGAAASGADCPGAVRADHGHGSGGATGGEPQNLLRVGETSVAGVGRFTNGSVGRTPGEPARSREDYLAGTEAGPAGATPGAGADAGDPPATDGTGSFQKKALTS